ncbi:MAG: hypothetical protein HY391_06060 [Deltaproteobacteria bacterium]|nr:hypothetical protein [Deltaproteobacteria bacterium]
MKQLLLCLGFTLFIALLPSSGLAVEFQATDDPDFRVTIEMFDGAKKKTENKRFIKATVSRNGNSFSTWCQEFTGVASSDGSVESELGCTLGVSTVSNDDDESLTFVLRRYYASEFETFYLLHKFDYVGDGTFLRKEVEILTGKKFNRVDDSFVEEQITLEMEDTGSDPEKDMNAFWHYLTRVLEGVVGKEVDLSENQRGFKIASIEYGVDHELNLAMTVVLTFGRNDSRETMIHIAISLLKEEGKLRSGLLSARGVQRRILKAIVE